MSRNIWRVFRYELKRNLQRKGFLFTTFGIPLISFALFYGYQFISQLDFGGSSGDTETTAEKSPQDTLKELALDFDFRGIQAAGYVDYSGLFSNPQIPLDGLIPYADETAAQHALDAGTIDVYYVIGQDFLTTGDTLLTIPHLALNKFNPAPVEKLVYNILAGDVDPALLLRLRFPANIQKINIQRENVVQSEGASLTIVYVFSITFLLGVFLTNGYLMQSVIEEKESQLIEILIASVRPTQLLAGKVLALGLLGLLQIVIWIGAIILFVRLAAGSTLDTLAVIANIHIPYEILPLLLAYFLLGYLFFAAAYGAVGALSSSMREGPAYAVIFTLPAAIPYYFFTLFVGAPDSPLPVALSIFPLTAPLSMTMRMVVFDVPTWEILVSLALLALSAVGMMWVAGRLFRVQTLLSGQVPRLRDIPKLLRG